MSLDQNYFYDLPTDIQSVIIEYSECVYVDIYARVKHISKRNNNIVVAFNTAILNNAFGYVSKRMHKNIVKFRYNINYIDKNSIQYINRSSNIIDCFKEYLYNLVSKLSAVRIKDLLEKVDIYDAETVYLKEFNDKRKTKDYSVKLLSLLIFKDYAVNICCNNTNYELGGKKIKKYYIPK